MKTVSLSRDMEMYRQHTTYTCGPACYLEAFSREKNRDKELELHEKGRIKPSRIFLGVSFLEIDGRLVLYTSHTRFTRGMLGLVYNKKIRGFAGKIRRYHSRLVERHKDRIIKTTARPESFVWLVWNAAANNKRVILLTNSSYWDEKDGTLHWVVVKGVDNGMLLVGDPWDGKTRRFTRKEVVEQLLLVKREGFPLQLVVLENE